MTDTSEPPPHRQQRGADEDFKFKFSPTYTVSNPDSRKAQTRKQPDDLLQRIHDTTRPTSLLPYRDLEKKNQVLTDAKLEFTPNFNNTMNSLDAQQRRIKTQKSAEQMMQQSIERRPEVHPMFVRGSHNGGKLKQVRLSDYTPTHANLIPPKLPLAEGAAFVGTDLETLGLPYQEIGQPHPEDELLFDLWNHRQAVRERRADEDKLSKMVSFPLSETVRQLVTREEAKIIDAVTQGQVDGTHVSISPQSKAASLSMKSKNRVGDALDGTARGVVLPIGSLEQVFRSLRLTIHETIVGLLSTYRLTRRTLRDVRQEDAEDVGVVRASVSTPETSLPTMSVMAKRESQMVDMEELNIQMLIITEENLATQAKDTTSLVPACVSLPIERVFSPSLAMETASSVAFLWKILSQMQSMVPGVSFGLHLFQHYILPHVYDSFSTYSNALPSLGGLSEQIMQLSTIPLRMEVSRLSSIAYEQSQEDARYIEHALKHWTLRGWRKNVKDLRQREGYLQNATQLVCRIRARRQLHAAFSAWRFEARNLSNMNYLDSVRQQYVGFLSGANLADQLRSSTLRGIAEPTGVLADMHTQRIATQLAKTAEHVKGKSPSSSATGPPPAPSSARTNPNTSVTTPRGSKEFPRFMSTPNPPDNSLSRAVSSLSMSSSMIDHEETVVMAEVPSAPLPKPPPAPSRSHDLQIKAGGTFEDMLLKLREMEEICNHLRSEIGVQSKMLRSVEKERDSLRQRNRQLEEEVLRVTEEKVHYCNVVQEKQFSLNDRDKRILQLKSRIRAHRNRPWQRVVLRVVGEICMTSTHISEHVDNLRIQADMKPPGVQGTAMTNPLKIGTIASGSEDEMEENSTNGLTQQEEEERLFGKLAPIVLSSSYPLPDALIILQDWANACLDDLQELDDLKGGALSTRFTSFSEEARNGILLSRLLFYLSLPRYLQRTSIRDNEKAADGEEVFGSNFPDRRRQLLKKFNVQLDSPFPVYPECFGDLLSMRPSDRMTLLLQFATELMGGSDMLATDTLEQQRTDLYNTIKSYTELQMPPPAARIELQEIIDPHALAMGERAAVVTLIALLYTRFSHPFNHKCKQSAELEKAAILHLLSGGTHLRRTRPSTADGGKEAMTIEEEIMHHLEDEDKSPWYLFKERCLPMFGTAAHPFLLRGNFWPSDAFDSPQLAEILGELGMALNRSAHLHRWHVVMSCLVPVMTYSGLSRGVFTGPRASSQSLRVGLEQEGEWNVPLHCRCLMRVYLKRAETLRNAVKEHCISIEEIMEEQEHEVSGIATPVNALPFELPTPPDASGTTGGLSMDVAFKLRNSALVSREAKELLRAIHLTSSDLLTLFLRRSTLSAELALPTLSLGGWRLLCTDLKLLASSPEFEDDAAIGMDVASNIFYDAVMALNEVANTAPTIPSGGKQHRSRANTFTSNSTSFKAPVVPVQDGTRTAIPKVSDDMTFAAFLIAMTLVSHELFPLIRAPSAEKSPSRASSLFVAFLEPSSSALHRDSFLESHTSHPEGTSPVSDALKPDTAPLLWLGNCLQHFMHNYIPRVAGDVLSDEPRSVVHRLTMGAGTQEVLARYTPAIILVFNAYSKDVYGAAGMEKDELLQLLRDAMLTSTEISQYLVFEVFQHCCVTRRFCEEEAAAKRREIDGKPRDGRRRAPRSVSIVDPSNKTGISPANNHKKDIEVLVYEGFVQFLCVMCNFKQPNPLIAYCQRLDVFLRRSVLRPLCHRVENLAPLLNQSRTGQVKRKGTK